MPITTREARALCTAGEWPLVEASRPAAVRRLSPARLKAKLVRARALRDKYVDLAKRQHRRAEARQRGTPDTALNERTTRKAELFSEVLGRFESAWRALAPAPGQAPARSGSGSRTTGQTRSPLADATAARAAAPVPRRVKASTDPAVPKSAIARRGGQARIHAHLASRGRRRQARRDSR